MRVLLCLLTASLCLSVSQVGAAEKADFAGTWSGTWKNSEGENGDLTMKLSEGKNGRVTGKWDDVEVKGRRTNDTTIELRGTNPTRSYQYTATIKGGTMHIKYLVTRLDSDGSYDGECTLTRD